MALYSPSNIPTQNRTWEEKKKNDYQWAKDCANAYINLSSFANNSYKLYLKKLYDYYNGHVYEEDYTTILAPYGGEKRINFPAEIRNYPIIRNKVDLLRGEFAKRPDNFTVVVRNEDSFTIKQEELNQQVHRDLDQLTINKLNELGLPTGEENGEVKHPKETKSWYDLKWKDKRAISGQNALSYIKSYNRVEEIYDISFLDWLTTGEVYTYRGVDHNEPTYEGVNPLDIDYDKDPDLQFVEDGDWVVRRKYMHPSTVIEMFYDELTEDEVREVEEESNASPQSFLPFTYLRDTTQPYKNYSRLVEVCHVVWKSRKKIGILSYIDSMGQPQIMQVDEKYKINHEVGDISIEWQWPNEVWETYRINNKFFKRMRPIPAQRGDLDNLSKCKLPYNGRVMSNRNSRNISMVALGVPYQINYNIVKYRLELALAKMKDVIALIDVNIVPKGWTIDKFLYYVDATGVGFVDYNKEGVKPNPQHQTEINLASKVLQSYIEILRFIDEEWSKVCGIAPQREGQIATQETVGGVERSVVQSSLITEIYFRLFDQFKERDYEALIDYSRIAWIKGKKASFVQPEYSKVVYMDLDGLEHSETEYGVFVSNSLKDSQKIQQLQSLMQPLIQNGAPGSSIAEIIDSESFIQIKSKLLEAENTVREYETFKAQQEQEAEQKAIGITKQMQDEQQAFESNENALDRENKILVAQINTLKGKDGPSDMNMDNIPDALEYEKLTSKERVEKMKLDLDSKMEDKRISHEKEMQNKELKIKEKEIDSRIKIARMKPKPTKK